jgi:hypothetical protein
MIKTAFTLVGVLLVAAIAPAAAETYPDSFADYLNARGLYFDYLSAAEESYWVRTAAGDIVLSLPSTVATEVSVVTAGEQPSDADLAIIRSDVELAQASALDRLGVRHCSSDDDQAACIPFALQIGFSKTHGDMIDMPYFRDSRGRQRGGFSTRRFVSHDKVYRASCSTKAETLVTGEVTHLDAAFTVEVIPSGKQKSDAPSDVLIDFGGSNVVLPQPTAPLTSAMEECILGLLGVRVLQGLPRDDLGYYVARNLETMKEAETYLTHEQVANDIPELVMTHALRKALGKDPIVGQ